MGWPPLQSRMRETYLDGLRGWAALVVVLKHVISGMVWPTYAWTFTPLFMDGTLAVYVFFVLSGYVLSVGFFRSGKRIDIADLSIRRFPRLAIPILAAAAIAHVFMQLGWMLNVPASKAASSEWLGWFYTFPTSWNNVLEFSLWRVFIGGTPDVSYDPPLWTMPIEMQGSILIFVLLFVVSWGNKMTRVVGHAGLIGALAWHGSPMVAMAVGVAIADFTQSDWHERAKASKAAITSSWVICGVALVCAALLSTTNALLYTWIGGVLLYWVLLNPGVQSVLNLPLSRWLGRVSFSLYLVHMLVLCSFSSWLYLALAPLSLGGNVFVLAASVALSLVAAAAFYPAECLGVVAGRKLSSLILSRSHLVSLNSRS